MESQKRNANNWRTVSFVYKHYNNCIWAIQYNAVWTLFTTDIRKSHVFNISNVDWAQTEHSYTVLASSFPIENIPKRVIPFIRYSIRNEFMLIYVLLNITSCFSELISRLDNPLSDWQQTAMRPRIPDGGWVYVIMMRTSNPVTHCDYRLRAMQCLRSVIGFLIGSHFGFTYAAMPFRLTTTIFIVSTRSWCDRARPQSVRSPLQVQVCAALAQKIHTGRQSQIFGRGWKQNTSLVYIRFYSNRVSV